MGLLNGTTPLCSANERCSQWARVYLKYCLCSTRDGIALSLGMVSVLSWGVAEVPQIIANYKAKSTEGLSVTFLMTWIVGDIFNLIGCLLEPATLPTQFYMALLYTATTVVLTAQTVYYSHIYHRLKANKISLLHKSHKNAQEDAFTKEKLLYSIGEKEGNRSDYQVNGSSPEKSGLQVPTLPIPVSSPIRHHYGSVSRGLHYMSARSLTRSPLPTAGVWPAHSRDSSRTSILTHDRHSSREPLLDRFNSTQSEPPLNTKNMLCVVSSAIFLLCIYDFHHSMNVTLNASSSEMIIQVGRKLLQAKVSEPSVGYGDGSSEIGSLLGWSMAAIYMGGRLPQIWLNIRRGNVEGLSPLMFLFALVGNSTYVGSILVNSMDWSKIKPNMPWLVDAGGCVILDAFIICQFIYFRHWKTKDVESGDDD